MKKLMLAAAVLAVLSISLFSFTKSPAVDDQNTYIWIRMNCLPYGSANPMSGYVETASPDMLPGVCPNYQPSGVCALQFHRSQVTCTEGAAYPRPGVSLWGDYRMIKYCTQ